MRDKDMYFPIWVCVLGAVLIAGGLVCLVFCFIDLNNALYWLIMVVTCIGLGIAGVLCWKNQWVKMIDQDEFIYSTIFGNRIKYKFSEIKGTKRNSDSMTLLLENGKVHIESGAIISETFIERVDQMLGRK